MAQNLFCKTQKANSQDFRDNFDRTFNHIHPKDCYANTPWMPKKEYLPGDMKDFLYPEEIRAREIERKLKKEELG